MNGQLLITLDGTWFVQRAAPKHWGYAAQYWDSRHLPDVSAIPMPTRLRLGKLAQCCVLRQKAKLCANFAAPYLSFQLDWRRDCCQSSPCSTPNLRAQSRREGAFCVVSRQVQASDLHV